MPLREILAILSAVSLTDLAHTTSGPGEVFTKMWIYLDDKSPDGKLWRFLRDAADCHRCLSFYITVVMLLLPRRVFNIIAPALIATKFSQAIYRRWEKEE